MEHAQKGASEAPSTHFRAVKSQIFLYRACPQPPSHDLFHGPHFYYLPWAPPIFSAILLTSLNMLVKIWQHPREVALVDF